MPMNRADYETVASVLHDAFVAKEMEMGVAYQMADALCKGNPSFNPWTFLQMVNEHVQEDWVREFSHGLRLRMQAIEDKRRKHFELPA